MALEGGLQISPGTGDSVLRPDQKRFNTLIRQIEQARQTLAAWQHNIALYAQAHVRVVVPLAKTLAAAHREWLFALDGLLNQRGWTKSERALLRELICDGAAQLLDTAGQDDPALKALFDKHGDVDFDTEQQQARATWKQMAEAVTGLDLGDIDDIASDEDLLARMRERLAAQAAGAQEQEQEQEQARTQAQATKAGPRRRKTAAQQRREAEAQLATQSVREVFRKLASALHPDRETDPVQRQAKTALMQKVNQAYAKGDLLALLELQLQIEQVDAAHIADAGAQRLKHYNKVLSEQLAELKVEVERVAFGFGIDFGLDVGWGVPPARLLGFIDRNGKEIRAGLARHQRDMRTFADPAATRRWLKREQKRARDAEFDDGFF